MLYLIEKPRVPWHAGSHELRCRSRCSQEFADWAVGSWVPRFAGLIWLADSNTEALRLKLDKKWRAGAVWINASFWVIYVKCSGVQVMTPRTIEKLRVYYLGANLSMLEANKLPISNYFYLEASVRSLQLNCRSDAPECWRYHLRTHSRLSICSALLGVTCWSIPKGQTNFPNIFKHVSCLCLNFVKHTGLYYVVRYSWLSLL